MVSTSLIIKTIQNDDEVSKTLANVNPDASYADLNSFARMYIGLSTQTYIDSFRVTKESLNEKIAEEG